MGDRQVNQFSLKVDIDLQNLIWLAIRFKYLLIALFAIEVVAQAVAAKENATSGGAHAVRGYVKKDGTQVAPHRQTNPNSTQRDNWSSNPNVNPDTGKKGVKEPRK